MVIAEYESLQSLNFDLFQNELKKAGFKNPKKAYKTIEKELKDLGYIHRQQSGYLSINIKQPAEVQNDVDILCEHLKWLSECVNHFTITSFNNILDLNPVIKNQKEVQECGNFSNTKEKLPEKRAIHFDLEMSKIYEL